MGSLVVLGGEPKQLRVNLTTGAAFQAVLTYRVDGVETPWPAGTENRLEFEDGFVAVAAIAGSKSTWTLTEAESDERADRQWVRWRYVNGADARVPWSGRVARNG